MGIDYKWMYISIMFYSVIICHCDYSTFRRVLPLPSDGWEEVSGTYFCHTHTHGRREEESDSTHLSNCGKLVPKDGDCLISSAQLLIRGSALDKNKVLIRNMV